MLDIAWLSVPPTRSLLRFATPPDSRPATAQPSASSRARRMGAAAWLMMAAVLLTAAVGTAQAADNNAPMSVSATFQPGEDGQGTLIVTMNIHRIWHTYSITQPSGGPLPTKIEVALPPGVKVGEFTALTKPEVHFDKIFEMNVEVHHGKAVWSAPVTFSEGQVARLTGAVIAQACKVGACLPPKQYPFAVEISAK